MDFRTIYHVFNRANARDYMFDDEASYERFLMCCKKHIYPVAEILAYCLIPNHFHLLVCVRSESDILEHIDQLNKHESLRQKRSTKRNGRTLFERNAKKFIIQSFSNCFNAYAKYFNIRSQRRGALFLKSFNRKKVDQLFYLRELYFYIHINPLKHKLRRNIDNWKYSSYRSLLDGSDLTLNLKYLFAVFENTEDFKNSIKDRISGKFPEVDIDDLPRNFKSFSLRF